jgi:hypothetical protein
LTSKSYNPGDAGFMNTEDEMDAFEGEIGAVLPDDIGGYAKEQYFRKLDYLDIEDDEEEWILAILEE